VETQQTVPRDDEVQEQEPQEPAPKTQRGKKVKNEKDTGKKKAPKEKKTKEAKKPEDGDEKKTKKGTLSPIPVSVVKSIKQKMDNEHPGMIKNMNEVKLVAEKFLETVVEMTKTKQSVALPNYFTLKPVLRNERVHRNPQNGETVKKPAHYVLCMDVKNKLKKEIAEIDVQENSDAKQ